MLSVLLMMCCVEATSADITSTYCERLPMINSNIDKDNFAEIDGGKFSVVAFNNKESFLVKIRIAANELKRKSLMMGANVYVNISRKKKETYYVKYPKIQRKMLPKHMRHHEDGEQDSKRPPLVRKDISQIIDELAFEPISMFNGEDEYMLRENEALIDESNGDIVLSLMLPYSKFSDKMNKKGEIYIELATREIKVNSESSSDDDFGGPGMPPPPPGGMPGGPGGMPPMMGGGSPFGSRSSGTTVYKKWVSILLPEIK